MANNRRWRNLLKLSAKIIITTVSLYIVFRKIDFGELKKSFFSIELLWVIPASILFIFSKIVSSYRLNYFFRCIQLFLSEKSNLKLYWLGMFYNLFLPGGIGGDGYKIYLLNRTYKTPVKKLFLALLLDRISGVAALLLLVIILGVILFPQLMYIGIAILLVAAGIFLFYIVYKYFFKDFLTTFWKSNMQGLIVQTLQVFCAFCLLMALHVEGNHVAYLLVFLLSSIVAVIPFTVGGLGARELTFVLAAQYFLLDKEQAVAVSFWFYIITMIVSLSGAWWMFRPPFQYEQTHTE